VGSLLKISTGTASARWSHFSVLMYAANARETADVDRAVGAMILLGLAGSSFAVGPELPTLLTV
jgi:hypothetical protein